MNRRNLPLLITLLIFVVAVTAASLQYPKIFSARVLGNLLTDNAFLGVAAVGMTFVIISGGIDLSVGSLIAFVGVFVAVTIQHGLDPMVAMALALVLTTLFGALMGAVIYYLETPPFIVTLAGMFLARGLCFVLTTDSIPINAPLFDTLSNWNMPIGGGGRLSLLAIMMLAVYAVGFVVARRTRFGTSIYALGGNSTSAELMGIPIARTTIGIYAVSGLTSGIAGLIFTFYTSAGYSLAAVGVELDTIAAVVIGGTLLTGGYGSVLGTFLGVLLQGLIQTYIVFDGTLSSWWTKIVIGVLLFAFIGLQRLLTQVVKRSA